MAAVLDTLDKATHADLPEHLQVVAEALARLRFGVIIGTLKSFDRGTHGASPAPAASMPQTTSYSQLI